MRHYLVLLPGNKICFFHIELKLNRTEMSMIRWMCGVELN